MSLRNSVSAKLLLVGGGTIGVMLLAGSFLLVNQVGAKVAELSNDFGVQLADTTANAIATDLARVESTGKSMAAALGALHERGVRDRQVALDVLKPNASSSGYVMGSWYFEAPNAWDGRDAEMAGQKALGSSSTGTFMPYWAHIDGKVSMEPAEDGQVYSEAFYTAPVTTGKPAMIDPYAYDVGNKTVLMTSVAFPVVSNGKIIGAAGLDIALDDLTKGLSGLKPLGDGSVMLLSGNGKWVAHPDAAQRTKPYSDAGADTVRAALANGEGVELDVAGADQSVIHRIVAPFELKGMGATWAVVMDVPAATIAASAHSLAEVLMAGGALVILAVLAALFGSVRAFVVKPLRGLTRAVEALGRGDYERPVEGTKKADEFGTVAKALDTVRGELAGGQRLRAEQEDMRHATEAQRDRQAAVDNAKAEDLKTLVHLVEAGFDALSAGDLTTRIDRPVAPEFEPIKRKFNASVAQLEGTVGSVVGAVDSMRIGLGQITVAAGDLSQRTEQQAAALEETVAALAEVVQGVTVTAQTADDARSAAAAAQGEAQKGGAVVAQAVQAMAAIENSSQQIGQIIGVIDEIAFQTNLLALNAGVEAARAGEAGRGFAVVAQEVRGLAQRSAEAAKEIKGLISTSAAQVGEGVELVSASGRSLEQIVGQVGEVAKVIAQMSRSAREQAVSLKEISVAADGMDKVTQQNAAMVEETTAAAQSLLSETEQLAGIVGQFRAGNQAGAAPRQRAAEQLGPRAVVQMRSSGKGGGAVQQREAAAPEGWEEF